MAKKIDPDSTVPAPTEKTRSYATSNARKEAKDALMDYLEARDGTEAAHVESLARTLKNLLRALEA